MLKIAICDDESYYVEKIKQVILNELEQRQITKYQIKEYSSGQELCGNLKEVKEHQIVFLDINMNGMNGIETAEVIRKVNSNVYIVFITAYADYAVEGYKVEAIRFVLKDALDKMLKECMDAILEKMRTASKKVKYRFVEGDCELLVDKIIYIESQKHQQIFYIEGNESSSLHLYRRLDDIEEELLPFGFLRIHKSYLVNIHFIKTVGNYKVELCSKEIFPVPRERYQEVRERYLKMLGEV